MPLERIEGWRRPASVGGSDPEPLEPLARDMPTSGWSAAAPELRRCPRQQNAARVTAAAERSTSAECPSSAETLQEAITAC